MDKHILNDERQCQILRCLIENYIRTGVPVGSSTLSRHCSINLSSASIRNVMAGLEKDGFLEAPHRSAGRVPTVLGYRVFVEQLLQPKPLGKAELISIRHKIIACIKGGQTLAKIGGLLSDLTRMAGIVTVRDKNQMKYLKRLEFIGMEGRKVLAVLMLSNDEVENRIFEVDCCHTDSELKKYANYLSGRFFGNSFKDIQLELLGDSDMNRMRFEAIALARQVFDVQEDGDYIISGQDNLINFEELSDAGTLRNLFEAFNRKKELQNIFYHCLEANKIKIFIGQKSKHTMLSDCSVVCAPYCLNNKAVGVFAVVGPVRIEYERVIPLVGAAADLFGKTLN